MENGLRKVLVTGDGGQLAWELKKTCPNHVELISLSVNQLDISNHHAVMAVFKQHKPDFIINAAAYTAVDNAESDNETAYAVNDIGSENLANACLEYKVPLIHVCTDFVFDGAKSIPYQVNDTPNPINVYGASKLAGSQKIQEILKGNATIIRTAWVYSEHGNNFVKIMLRLMNERDTLNIVSDQIGSPTWAKGLAQLIWALIAKRNKHIVDEEEAVIWSFSDASFQQQSELMHWTDAGVASWYDFAVAIQDIALEIGLLDQGICILPISASEYPTPAKRPSYSVLDKSYAESVSAIKTEHWRHQLSKMMKQQIKTL